MKKVMVLVAIVLGLTVSTNASAKTKYTYKKCANQYAWLLMQSNYAYAPIYQHFGADDDADVLAENLLRGTRPTDPFLGNNYDKFWQTKNEKDVLFKGKCKKQQKKVSKTYRLRRNYDTANFW